MKVIEGGITVVAGFLSASTTAGIKYKSRQNMTMIYSGTPYKATGTFTTNIVKVAPVKWGQNVMKNSSFAQAMVINAGIANVCTGAEGYEYCRGTVDMAVEVLKIPANAVPVASTGVIGMQLPTDRITAGAKAMAPKLDGSTENRTGAAQAIMTTDTKKKEVAMQVELSGKIVTIGGMCKGSGMIHPDICTMLAFVTTDAAISKELLQEALSEDIQGTYNMISVDGDISTNDMVPLLANGMSRNPKITEENEDYETFKKVLNYVNEALAKKMAGDGEGCTALSEMTIVGAENKEQARILAKSVITPSLIKAAIFGHDANWGRILCTMGYSGAILDLEKVDLFFQSAAGKMQTIENGAAVGYSEEQATKILSEPEMTAIADVKTGDATASAWGCDLTFDYVKINADYRS